eukprot:252478_1
MSFNESWHDQILHDGQPAPTRLVTMPIYSIADAGRIIGESQFRNGSRIAPLILIPSRSFIGGIFRPFISIPNGFSAVVTKYGRFVGIWRPGFHWASPTIRVSHLIPQEYMIFDYPIKECPTQDNVMVEIDVTLVFHILQSDRDLKEFAYKLGPEKLDKLLKAFQEEAVRDIARKRKYNQIYDLMNTREDEQLKNSMRRMNANLLEYGVEVNHITITNVHLPGNVAKTMEIAAAWASKNSFIAIKQDYELLKIDNIEQRAMQIQKVAEEREQTRVEYEKKIAMANANLKKIQAETDKIVAEISEQTDANALEILTKSELEVAKSDASKDVELDKIEALGSAEVQKLISETRASIKALRAKTDLAVASNKAKALSFRSSAEHTAARHLKQRRTFERKMQQFKALRNLAENDNVCLSGSNTNNLLASILSVTRQNSVLGINMNEFAGSQLRIRE